MLRRLVFVAALALPALPAAAQSRSQGLVNTAREHMAARDFDKADVELSSALSSALYLLDSVNVFIWRGVLEHLRGNDSLARLSFRQVVALHQVNVRGLDNVSPGLGDLFESEARPYRVYSDSELDQRAAWASGPKLAYPPELRRRGVAGHAIVHATIDSLGKVEALGLLVLESPDPAFDMPLQQMMLAAQFTPARRKGHAVRSAVTLGFDLHPPAPENPTLLITSARDQLRAHRPDSALALTEQALDSANQPTAGERVYALLVQGVALRQKGRDSLATASLDAGIAGYRDLIDRGTDLAPFLKRLADSVRISRRPVPPPFAAPTVVGTVDEPPALLRHPPIRYAPEMQSLRIGGTVIVEATLDTTGRVLPASVKVVQSPNPVFDAESKRVVQAAVYRPARMHGRAARVTIRQPITFAAY
ncbi:MAG TPA: energy transducer TonB [Gemmatimonadales bacterium]|nr:energy transducer TonB [Gemmatimonadales bacterium]